MRFYSLIYFLCACAAVEAAQEPKLVCQQKWKEVEVEGMKIRLYRLRAEAFPAGQDYKLFIRTVDGATTETFKYVSNAKGHLLVNEPQDVLKAAPYIVTPLRRGELVGYGMISAEGKQEYYTKMVPFPNETVKGKLKVAVDLADINGRSFVCRGSGFSPNEVLNVEVSFGEQIASYETVVHSDGSLLFPFSAPDDLMGDARLTLVYAQGSISVSFPWGQKAGEFVGASCLEIK